VQGRCGEIQQPGADDAAATPDLGDFGHIDVVLVQVGMAQRRGLCIGLALHLAGVGIFDDVQTLRIGRHDSVFDAVVNHLDEAAGAVGPQCR